MQDKRLLSTASMNLALGAFDDLGSLFPKVSSAGEKAFPYGVVSGYFETASPTPRSAAAILLRATHSKANALNYRHSTMNIRKKLLGIFRNVLRGSLKGAVQGNSKVTFRHTPQIDLRIDPTLQSVLGLVHGDVKTLRTGSNESF